MTDSHLGNDTKPMTRWKNPTDKPWKLEIWGAIGWDQMDGFRTLAPRAIPTDEYGGTKPGHLTEVVIPPGGEVELPSEYDDAIHQRVCTACGSSGQEKLCVSHPELADAKVRAALGRNRCVNPTHAGVIVGGMGKGLIRLTPLHPLQPPAKLHPALVETKSPQPGATTFAAAPNDEDEALLQRARKAGSK
jgi:hypothetical protein